MGDKVVFPTDFRVGYEKLLWFLIGSQIGCESDDWSKGGYGDSSKESFGSFIFPSLLDCSYNEGYQDSRLAPDDNHLFCGSWLDWLEPCFWWCQLGGIYTLRLSMLWLKLSRLPASLLFLFFAVRITFAKEMKKMELTWWEDNIYFCNAISILDSNIISDHNRMWWTSFYIYFGCLPLNHL